MRDRRILLGVGLGLLVALLAPAAGGRGEGLLLSDCDGRIRELVVHWVPEARERVGPTYRDLLRALPEDVTVRVACPDLAAFDGLVAAVAPARCRLVPVPTGHAMTTWSRDRWLALDLGNGRTRLLLPREEEGAAHRPDRAGDARVGFDLARALSRRVTARRSALGFDGGDFAADLDTVFVSPRVARRNGAPGLPEVLERAFGRPVTLLDRAPDHHAGMYLMPAGDRRLLVADPALAEALLPPGAPDPNPAGTDDDPGLREVLDRVAATARAVGYRVRRIPAVPGRDGRTWLTWVNVLIDGRPEGRVVYMPAYAHVPTLNDAAEAIWRDLGYEVRRIDCTGVYPLGGSLRCLVNVLARDGPAPVSGP